MTRLRLLLISAIVTLMATLCASTPVRAEACSAELSTFGQLLQSGDIDKAVAAYSALSDPAKGCGEHVLFCQGNSLARAFLISSYDAADKGASATEIEAILQRAHAFGSPWQLLVGLGDVNLAKGNELKDGARYQAAASFYQDALNVISEDPVCADMGAPPLPTVAEIAPIHKRMEEALLLAPEFEIVRTRAGDCGGIFLANIRGFTPTGRPIPITFDFDKSTLTESGAAAAKILLDCARQEGFRSLTLSGHTDPVGSAEYNLGLSQSRLETVVAYLKAGGYDGELKIIAKGESEPFQADDPTAYTQDELYRLDRRVVLEASTN